MIRPLSTIRRLWIILTCRHDRPRDVYVISVGPPDNPGKWGACRTCGRVVFAVTEGEAMTRNPPWLWSDMTAAEVLRLRAGIASAERDAPLPPPLHGPAKYAKPHPNIKIADPDGDDPKGA